MHELRHAWQSLQLHRLRSLLSALGIVCGVSSFVAILGMSEGARRETLSQIEHLGLRNVLVRASSLSEQQSREALKSGSLGLHADDAVRLRTAVADIVRVGAAREVAATVIQPERATAPDVLAVTPDYLALMGLEIASGRAISEHDLRSRYPACVVGQEVARRMGAAGQPGGTLRVEGSVCKIVGVLRRVERRAHRNAPVAGRDFDSTVAVALGFEDAFRAAPGAVTELVLEMRSEEAVLAALPALRRSLDVAHRGVDDYRVVAPQELLAQARQARRNFDILGASLAALCVVAGGIGIMNTLLASVTERTREIGVRRAVGATQRHIAVQFLAEAAILSGGGAVAGLLLGAAATWVVSAANGWVVAFTWHTLVSPLAAAIAAGLFFGIYPAMRAARLHPVEALRHG